MNSLLRPEQLHAYEQMLALIEQTVAPSSWRVYADTYRQWADWCGERNVDLFEITPVILHDFLVERGKTHATRQRMLSSMRRVANYLAAARPGDARQQLYAQVVRDMRAPDEGTRESGRDLRSLSPDEVNKILAIWGHKTPTASRNSAIIALLFATWLRRSELAVVQWKHFVDEHTLKVPVGKGKKSRTVTLVGDYAGSHLAEWWNWQGLLTTGDLYNNPRQCAFCGVRGDKLLVDEPISDDTVYRVVIETSERSGVHFTPHQARHTGITEALEIGGDSVLPDVQAQAGHSKASTTLGYAQLPDAKKRRGRLKSRFGK